MARAARARRGARAPRGAQCSPGGGAFWVSPCATLEYPMPLSHRSFGAARVVAPAGRVDHDSCEAFQADLGAQLDACRHEGSALVVDLSHVDYISSAGLRCLMIAARQ